MPQRPRLSYSIEQRREIADGLVRDREHALYMERQLRYQIGESPTPPPLPPPGRGPDELPHPAAPEPKQPTVEERGSLVGWLQDIFSDTEGDRDASTGSDDARIIGLDVRSAGQPVTVLAFSPGSAALPSGSSASLGEVVAAAGPNGRIHVTGYASEPDMAMKRANATAAALSELGAPAESLDVRTGDAAATWDEVRISIEPGAVN